jgi:hypothetical protein
LKDIETLARQKRLSAADSRAQRAAAALLRINPDAYGQAAAHYGGASRIAIVADALKAREYLRAQASALVRLGDEFGDNAALREAIEVLEAMPAGGDRAKDPHDWAATQNNLGTALASSASGRAGRRGSKKRLLLFARRFRNGRASGFLSSGRERRPILAMRSKRLVSGRAGRRGSRKRSPPIVRRFRNGRVSELHSTGR